MKLIEGKHVNIKSWCMHPEEGALAQARNLASLPFMFKHVCLMPDTHQGFGMPIGGVIATKEVVIPNAVGVDIGCGMCAIKTSQKAALISGDQMKMMMNQIRRWVPVGFNHHKKDQKWDGFKSAPNISIIQQELNSARRQIGTLGGGNHFIELQHDESGFLWIMVHSGSRNFGLKIAKEYNNLAKRICREQTSRAFHPEYDLAYLSLNSKKGQEYLKAMNYALSFAQANRQLMMDRVCEILEGNLQCSFGTQINIHHNYAAIEKHFGTSVVVHRKGATAAYKDQYGIIPGSQGTESYIVKGKGNPESFMSSSHGAGRVMSRKRAQRELNLEFEKKRLDDKGIIHSLRSRRDLDEASSAYKDINIVMREQEDLAQVVVKLEPLAVIKG